MATLLEQYGYGYSKESAQVIRMVVNMALAGYKDLYKLKISVRKSNSGYGGPSVDITSPLIELDNTYTYIIDKDGNPADCGQLVTRPVSSFTYKNQPINARVNPSVIAEQLNERVRKAIAPFGRDNDDCMTDYFDNTKPLFYGVEYKEVK